MIKILDIENIKLVSVNAKYQNKSFTLSKDYRNFKKTIEMFTKDIKIKKPQRVLIEMETALDIDNAVKPILDSIEKVFGNDKHVQELIINKTPIKRGKAGRLKIYAETIKNKI